MDSNASFGKHTYVPALDGLRAMVLLVPLAHLEYMLPLFLGTPVDALLKHLGFTLALFFVLSGFLITWILSSEYEASGSISLSGFYQRRAQRLLPAYATALLVSCALLISRGVPLLTIGRDLIWFLTYTYNIGVAWHGYFFAALLASLMRPAWSLCVEEQFYFSWAFLMRWLKPNRAFVFVVLAVIASPVYRGLAYLWLVRNGYSRDQIFEWMYYATEANIGHIFTGCAMALALRHVWFYQRMQRLARWRLSTSIAVVSVISLFIAVPILLGSMSRHIPLVAFTVGYSTVSIGVAAVVLNVIMKPQSFAVRMLSNRALVYIGRISYGIYIFHYILINVIVNLNLSEYGGNAPLGIVALEWIVVLAGAIAVAGVHYRFIELPILRRRKRQSGVAERLDVLRNFGSTPATLALAPGLRSLEDVNAGGRPQSAR